MVDKKRRRNKILVLSSQELNKKFFDTYNAAFDRNILSKSIEKVIKNKDIFEYLNNTEVGSILNDSNDVKIMLLVLYALNHDEISIIIDNLVSILEKYDNVEEIPDTINVLRLRDTKMIITVIINKKNIENFLNILISVAAYKHELYELCDKLNNIKNKLYERETNSK